MRCGASRVTCDGSLQRMAARRPRAHALRS
jgi:hypothetical protein